MLLDIIIVVAVVYLSLVLGALYIFSKSGFSGIALLLAVFFPIIHVFIVMFLSLKYLFTGRFKSLKKILLSSPPIIAMIIKEVILEEIAMIMSEKQYFKKSKSSSSKKELNIRDSLVRFPSPSLIGMVDTLGIVVNVMKELKVEDFKMKTS